MNRSAILFLQIAIVIIGIGAIGFLLYEPHLEGRNTHSTLFEIYFRDPFLAYVYVASIPFFIILYHATRVLKNIGQDRIFSRENLKALRTIKFCAFATVGLAALGEIFILQIESDDRAGGIFIGALVISGSLIIAAFASVFKQVLQKGMEIDSENKYG